MRQDGLVTPVSTCRLLAPAVHVPRTSLLASPPSPYPSQQPPSLFTMSDQIQELVDTPSQFLKDGVQFMNKCQKRTPPPPFPFLHCSQDDALPPGCELTIVLFTADQKEFAKICQAVGTGFVIMGVVGYVVKLSMCEARDSLPCAPLTVFISLVHIPINQILVGGA